MTKNKTKLLVTTALLTALCACCTAFISVPMIGTGGYVHFGDAIIMISASVLPCASSLFVGAVGGVFGDLLVGAPVWAPFTFVVKALVVLCFTNKKEKIVNARNIFGIFPALVITLIGYYFAEALIYGNFIAPFASMIGNTIQIVVSGVIYVVFGIALDKINFKQRF
ncbi:MAG: TIGR04002 family protein [Clostridia bacterium]|nr:TIGR04002 family protein [Clostridia bacterium]